MSALKEQVNLCDCLPKSHSNFFQQQNWRLLLILLLSNAYYFVFSLFYLFILISKNTIAQILETARIEEVIGDFVSLKKSGSNWKGLSPFGNEKTPSFYVSPAKGIFKDFSSGKAGNVVSFLMEQEHLTYPEALRFLAKKIQY